MKRFISCVLLTTILLAGCSCQMEVNNKPVKPKSYKVTSQGKTWVVDDFHWNHEGRTLYFTKDEKNVWLTDPYVVEEQ